LPRRTAPLTAALPLPVASSPRPTAICGGYTALQRSALLQLAWDHVSSALDGRESAFELHASCGTDNWRSWLRRSVKNYM
jgi:4-hydroxyphenylacetate 3-monooxygenase